MLFGRPGHDMGPAGACKGGPGTPLVARCPPGEAASKAAQVGEGGVLAAHEGAFAANVARSVLVPASASRRTSSVSANVAATFSP